MLTTTLAEQANQHHADAQAKAQEAVQHAIEAGRLLTQAKAALPHGTWSAWLADNFDGSARTAREYMKLSNRLDALPESKRQHAASLPSLRQALAVVADDKPAGGKRTESEIRQEPAWDWRDEPVPAWLPTSTRTVATWQAREPLGDDDFPPVVRLQRDADHPDHWHVFGINEAGECTFTKRGLLGCRVPLLFKREGLSEILPDPAAAVWQCEDIGRDFVKRVLIDTIQD